ncbi:MAG: hypothetical protein ACTSSH_05245 [Candidatus Heimdallarchaeota archaeon]
MSDTKDTQTKKKFSWQTILIIIAGMIVVALIPFLILTALDIGGVPIFIIFVVLIGIAVSIILIYLILDIIQIIKRRKMNQLNT